MEKHLQRPVDGPKLRSCVARIDTRYEKIKRHVKNVKQFAEFQRFLATLWAIVAPRPPEEIQKRGAPSSSTGPSSSTAPLAKKLRSDCDRCPVMTAQLEALAVQHQKELQLLRDEISKLKADCAEARCARDVAMKDKWKYMGYFHKRVDTVDRLRKISKARKARLDRLEDCESSDISRTLRNVRISRTFKIKDIAAKEEQVKELETVNRELKKEIRGLELYIDDLECSREVREVEVIAENEEKPPRLYFWKTRKVMYRSLDAKVPYRYVADLVEGAVLDITGVKIGHLPSKSTISRMIYEVSVLCLLQATEALLKSPQATLCWDATSIEDKHINEIHVETTEGTFTLSMCVLPGGKAVDYVTHMTDVIDKMVLIYSEYTGLDALNVKNDIVSRIGSTLSDRAAVNHAAVRDLRDLWNQDLVELHCNLHPLDSFSSGTRTQLKKMDLDLGMPKTGREDCISNMLYALSRLG